jgi:MHS family proline/betaine transporter-like MFS transporter
MDSGVQRTSPQQRRSVAVGALGTIIEWYDFSLYVYLAPVFARVFFGDEEGLEGLIATFGVFAIAYVARPIGAIVFGSIGDKVGRRSSLVVSAGIMAVALLLTAALPDHDTIGLWAAILLLVLRLAMGFAVGGEYSGILVFLLETAGDRRRGLIASLSPATSGLGTLLAVGISTVIVAVMSQDSLDSWGWRIPFVIGALMAGGILLLRRGVEETKEFKAAKDADQLSKRPMRDALRFARHAVVIAFAVSAVGSITYYVGVTYVPSFLESVVSVGHDDALLWSTVAAAVLLVVTPLFGWWSDRAGRRPVLVGIAVATAVAGIPLFALLAGGTAAGALLGAVALAIPAGAWSAVAASAIPEQFRTRERFSGIAIGYNLATVVFGGLAPLIATVLIQWTGSDLAPGILLVAVVAIVLPVVWRMRETAHQPLQRD